MDTNTRVAMHRVIISCLSNEQSSRHIHSEFVSYLAS